MYVRKADQNSGLVREVLGPDYAQRKEVQKDDNSGTPIVVILDNGKPVDHDTVVFGEACVGSLWVEKELLIDWWYWISQTVRHVFRFGQKRPPPDSLPRVCRQEESHPRHGTHEIRPGPLLTGGLAIQGPEESWLSTAT